MQGHMHMFYILSIWRTRQGQYFYFIYTCQYHAVSSMYIIAIIIFIYIYIYIIANNIHIHIGTYSLLYFYLYNIIA